MSLYSDTAQLFVTELSMDAEQVTYKPKAGGTRSIWAIIERGRVEGLGNAPHGTSRKLVMNVNNDSTLGIASDEVDCGGDLVAVAVRLGASAQDRPITEILNQDTGMMRLGVD